MDTAYAFHGVLPLRSGKLQISKLKSLHLSYEKYRNFSPNIEIHTDGLGNVSIPKVISVGYNISVMITKGMNERNQRN